MCAVRIELNVLMISPRNKKKNGLILNKCIIHISIFITVSKMSIFRYWDALNDLNEEDPEDSDEVPEDTPAWVRCSAADLYYTKDLKVL